MFSYNPGNMLVLYQAPFKKFRLKMLDDKFHLIKNYKEKTLKFLELRCRVYQVNMTQKHCPAAISLQAKLVEHFLAILAFCNSISVRLPQVRYRLSAATNSG